MIVALSLAVVAALGTLLCLVWLLTRNPAMARELKAERAENKAMHALLGRLHSEALGYADVNPVAQVFADEIREAGYAPAQLKGN